VALRQGDIQVQVGRCLEIEEAIPLDLAVLHNAELFEVFDVGATHHVSGRIVEERNRAKLGDHVLAPEGFGEHADVEAGTEILAGHPRHLWCAIRDVRHRVPEGGERLGQARFDEAHPIDHPGFGKAQHLVCDGGLADLGTQVVVSSINTNFLSPGVEGDQLIVESWVEEVKRVTTTFGQRILRGDTVLADQTVIGACLNEQGRPMRFPAVMTEAMRTAMVDAE